MKPTQTFTPGPWTATGCFVYGPNDEVLGEFHHPSNAAAAASAPALFAACQSLLAVYEELHARFDLGECEATIQARAALTLAQPAE